MSTLNKLLEWVNANPVLASTIILMVYALAGRIAEKTKTKWDDEAVGWFKQLILLFCKIIRLDILFPDDPKPPAPPEPSTDTVKLVSTVRARRRPFLVRFIRRRAELAGIDLKDVSDDAINDGINTLELEASSNGPIRDFLAWLINNPDKVISLITMLLTVFAKPQGGEA